MASQSDIAFQNSRKNPVMGEDGGGPAVSVIIPVYRVEAYIRRSVECLLGQTLQPMEFIFVDDCGGDRSMDIVREYAAHDNRIRIVESEKNEGAGAARNKGIAVAKGKYIAFFDADDTCDTNMYEVLYRAAEKNDATIAKCSRVNIFPDGKRELSNLNDNIRNQLRRGGALYATFTYEHTTAIFLRQHVEECHAVNGRTRVDEDTSFLLQVTIGQEKRFVIDDSVSYHYLRRDGSLTTWNYEYCLQQVAAKKEKLEILNQRVSADDAYKGYVRTYLNHLSRVILPHAVVPAGEGPADFETYLRKMIDYIRTIRGYEQISEGDICPEARILHRLSLQEPLPSSCELEFMNGLQGYVKEIDLLSSSIGNSSCSHSRRVKLFGFIPLFKIKETPEATIYKLFHFLPVMKVRRRMRDDGILLVYLLFGCIPVCVGRQKNG